MEAEREGAVPTGPAVRGGAKPPSVLCVGRDVVVLWPSAERGIAVRSDTTVGSTRSHPRL